MAPAQRFQVAAQARLQAHRDAATGILLALGPWVVPGQADQRRCPGQLADPVIGLLAQRIAAQPAPLPQGIVDVLHRQGWQRVVATAAESLVQRPQLAYQHGQRPAVGHQMMQGQQQHMVVRGELQHARPHRQVPGQGEGSAGLLANQRRQR
ncbi:hypothetical protein D3C80_1484930 [compost metagenome]